MIKITAKNQATLMILCNLVIALLWLPQSQAQALDAADGQKLRDPIRHKQVTLVTEPWGWYMGPELPQQGFLAAVVRESLAFKGYQVELEFMPWSRAIELVRRGEKDALLGVYYSETRAQSIYFSSQIATEREVLFARAGVKIDLTQPNALYRYRLGVIRGALHGDLFFDGENLNKVETTSREQLVQMLMNDRIDLFASPKSVVEHLIRTRFPEYQDDIVALQPELTETAIYLGFSRNIKNYEQLQIDFNEGLAQLRQSGRYDELKSLALEAK